MLISSKFIIQNPLENHFQHPRWFGSANQGATQHVESASNQIHASNRRANCEGESCPNFAKHSRVATVAIICKKHAEYQKFHQKTVLVGLGQLSPRRRCGPSCHCLTSQESGAQFDALKGSLGTSQCPSPFVLVAVLGSLCTEVTEVTHSLSQNPQLMLVATSPSACHICSKTQSCGICMSHLPLWRYDLGNAKHEQRPAEF